MAWPGSANLRGKVRTATRRTVLGTKSFFPPFMAGRSSSAGDGSGEIPYQLDARTSYELTGDGVALQHHHADWLTPHDRPQSWWSKTNTWWRKTFAAFGCRVAAHR